jgi:hypothetical protein
MRFSYLYRRLIGIADSEMIFLRPFLIEDQVDVDDVGALQQWCFSSVEKHEIKLLSIAKFTSLGVFNLAEMGDPVELLETSYVGSFAPAAFFKWKILESLGENDRHDDVDKELLLDFAVRERYPPALVSMAFNAKNSGQKHLFDQLIVDAAELGDPFAMNWVGSELLSSMDIAQRKRGLDFLESSAGAGFFLACVQLESIYRAGRFGVPVNVLKADSYAEASDVERS